MEIRRKADAMVHTYRDKGPEPVREHRLLRLGALLLVALTIGMFVVAFGSVIVDAIANGVRWNNWGLIAFVVFVAWTLYHHNKRLCLEIRLSDDGTCELETRRRVVRLHVNQISAVEYAEDDENPREWYTVEYNGGSILVPEWADFADFLQRLKALNPAVDLSSFPSAWPDADAAETSGTGVMRFLQSALFPLVIIIIIILALVWLATSS